MSAGAPKAPLTYEGEYDDSRTYLPRHVVSEAGGAYMSTATTTGHRPPDRAFWLPLGREREALFSTATAPVAGQVSPPYGVNGPSTALRFRVFLPTAGSSSSVVKLYLNGAVIASITLASGALSGSTTLAEPLADGDVLTVAATTVGAGVTGMTAIAYTAA